MKLFTYRIVVVFVLLCSACDDDEKKHTIPCVPATLHQSVLAFYPFSNGSLNDFSGKGYHLTNTTGASAAPDRDNNTNCAFAFDNVSGSAQFLTKADPDFLNGLQEFSISLWYMPAPKEGLGNFETLVSRDEGPSCPDRDGQWSVGLYDCRKAVFGRTNSVWDLHSTGGTCDEEHQARTNTWHHLVVTFKSDNVEMAIYHNGVLQDSSTGDAECFETPVVQDIGDLFIGQGYTGKIDDLVIFNKVLSNTEITELLMLDPCCVQ
jgi:hypothetical protein